MDVYFVAWLLLVSFGTSALGGILGMASGIFIVPVLTMFGGVEIHAAIGASLVSVIACSCGGASAFLEHQLTNVRLAIVLETATTLGAVTGVLLVGLIPVSMLYLLFALILVISAQQMLARRTDETAGSGVVEAAIATSRWPSWSGRFRLHASYPDRVRGIDVPYRVRRLPLGMVLMYGAGLISALLGIGSGVLKIPAMDTALRLPIKVSSATSNFMIGVTAAASAGAYFLRGDIVPAIAGPVAVGSVVGALVGAHLLMAMASDRIRFAFVAVLLVLAVQMCFSAFGIHPFGGAA